MSDADKARQREREEMRREAERVFSPHNINGLC